MSNVDIDRLDALFVDRHKSEAHYNLYLVTLNRDAKYIMAELRTLRARVAELERCRQETERQYQEKVVEISGLLDERDRLRAERDAAQAEAAGLREAAKAVEVLVSGGYFVPHETLGALTAALARTPAQHRARIEAGVMREAANRAEKETENEKGEDTSFFYGIVTANTLREWADEAERLEKEAGRG